MSEADRDGPEKTALDAQERHWEATFVQKPDMFGREPSEPAVWAAERFRQVKKLRLLELGCGQGRDTLFFGRSGFRVTAVDYSQGALDAVTAKAQSVGLAHLIETRRQDVRDPFPFPDESFDGCYSHMLYCMALTTVELERLSQQVRRVLVPGGLNVYTVRHTGDRHRGTGIHRGEEMWEVGGFIVHFFDREKVVHLAKGYEIVSIDEFEEGGLPRKLFRVTLRKPAISPVR
jgi:SAM-dependent methyltransferase